MPKFPRETREFFPVNVRLNGTVITTGVEFSATPYGSRAHNFMPAAMLEGKTGIMIENMEPGNYRVWARVTTVSETPVMETRETIQIT